MTFEDFIKEWRGPEDYIVAQTSGSTGVPKEIRLKKNFVKKSALRTIDFFKLNNKSRLHSCVAPDFIGGKMMAVRSEIAKSEFSWEVPSNTPLKDLTPEDTIDLLAVVPSQMIHILENLDRIPVLRNIIIGGSAIHPSLRIRIANSGLNAYETYGMTETASHIALRKISNEDIPFKTLEGITVDKGNEDRLIINLENDLRIVTNDVAEIISPTEFKILGRSDNVIISGGKKINAETLEAKLSAVLKRPEYPRFYVTGLPDEKWGQKIVLVLEGHLSEELEKRIISLIEPRVERWEMPKEVRWIPRFSFTPNGKLQRQ